MTTPPDEPPAQRLTAEPPAAEPEAKTDAEVTAAVEAEAEEHFTERFIAFSDAVLAIAITLLALALPVPGGVEGWTDGQLLHALGHDWDQYLAFLISFLVVGNHWLAHRRIFRYVSAVSKTIGWLNMLWLLLMILTPPAAVLLSGDGAFGLRFGIYTLVQVIATGALLGISWEVRHKELIRPGSPATAYHPDIFPAVAICVVFALSIPVAFFSHWAYAIWFAIPVLARILRRMGPTRQLAGVKRGRARRRPGQPRHRT